MRIKVIARKTNIFSCFHSLPGEFKIMKSQLSPLIVVCHSASILPKYIQVELLGRILAGWG